MKEIDKIINCIYNDDPYNFKLFTDLLMKYNRMLNVKNRNQKIVLKNALMRIFFDRFYILYPDIINENNSNSYNFGNTCNSLRWSTPKAIDINPNLMKPEYMDKPFISIVHSSEVLQEASKELQMLEFFTNPIDIFIHTFSALKVVDNFVKASTFEKRVGKFITMFDKSLIISEKAQMSFDDIFLLFCLIFTVYPPSNSKKLSTFLSKMSGISFEPPLEYAKLFLVSTIQYIENYKVSELFDKENTVFDSGDPLGVLPK